MKISSMTGFSRSSGRCQVRDTLFDWAFEMKSVNGKNLDFKVRLPSWLDVMSLELKSVAQKYFERGTINVNLDISADAETPKVKINEELLNLLSETALNLAQSGKVNMPTAGELLNINGVVEIERKTYDDELIDELKKVLLADFEKCCIGLQNDRQKEGEKIAEVLGGLLKKISDIVEQIVEKAEKVPTTIAEKLKQQISEFLGNDINVTEERLAQEIVFLVNKADIREEIDRLRAHLKTAEQLLNSGQSVGRRMDFLCQEFNREANTTCSKAADVQIINCGMELKATIEQLREQVQNME